MTPILALHAIGLDGRLFDDVDFGGAPVCSPDLPGHGRRRPPRRGLTLDDMVDEIVGWNRTPVHVVGVSLGCAVAMLLTVRHPQLVRSAVFVASGRSAPRQILLDRADALEAHGASAAVASTLQRWFPAAWAAANPDVVDEIGSRLNTVDVGSTAATWRALAEHDVSAAQLAAISVPVTCVAGRDDAATPVDAVRDVASCIPLARFVELATGHMAPVEDAAAFSRMMADHLEYAEGASR